MYKKKRTKRYLLKEKLADCSRQERDLGPVDAVGTGHTVDPGVLEQILELGLLSGHFGQLSAELVGLGRAWRSAGQLIEERIMPLGESHQFVTNNASLHDQMYLFVYERCFGIG